MNGKMLVSMFAIVAGLALGLLGLAVLPAHAGIEPVLAVNQVFAALNAGDDALAAAQFAEGAAGKNEISQKAYQGVAEIRQLMQSLAREGRRFEIVHVEMNGDTITVSAEVSDNGMTYGTQIVEAKVRNGKLSAFTIKAFRLELWKVGR